MSLVNDMLRDLDQRRKQTDGSATASSLTPVPEMIPEKAKQPAIIYLMAALVLAGVAFAWFWLQQESAEPARQLDIVPRVVDQQSSPEARTPQLAESGSNLPVQSPEAIAPESSEEVENSSNESVEQVQRAPVQEVPIPEASIALNEAESSENVSDSAPASAAENVSSPEQSGDTRESSDSSGVELANNSNEPEAVTPADSSTGSAGVATVDLSQAANEDVKIDAELTPEERDVLAVQAALRLIADNNLIGAYEVLEQQVVDNRYAHQSRETYAKLLLNEGNLQGAMQLVDAGLTLSANHAGFKKIKARLLIASGELDAAVNLLIARAPEVARDLEYHDILATAQLASRDYEGALISYTELVQQDQSQGKWWYGFAASQDLLGNSNAAKQGYSQAVRMPNLSANLRRRSQERLASLD